MDQFSLDQMRVLLAVVRHGSFSAAARALNRAQSAVTYTIRTLEDGLGVALFDRAGYRPALTEAGRVLLPRAQRLVQEADGFGMQARSIAGGLEAELTLVVDALFPMCHLLQALHGFSAQFPDVPTRLYVEALGIATTRVRDDTCMLGLLPSLTADPATLTLRPLLSIELVPVVACNHALARLPAPISDAALHDEVQLVLSDHSTEPSPDRGVRSPRTWRIGDLGAKHAMLLAGLGWGNMPRHMIADDVAAGRLCVLQPENAGIGTLEMCVAFRTHRPLGPAARWMIDHLAQSGAPSHRFPHQLAATEQAVGHTIAR